MQGSNPKHDKASKGADEKIHEITKEAKEKVAKAEPTRAVDYLKKRPSVGALLAGGLGFAAANFAGVGEVAIAFVAAYAAYRALRS